MAEKVGREDEWLHNQANLDQMLSPWTMEAEPQQQQTAVTPGTAEGATVDFFDGDDDEALLKALLEWETNQGFSDQSRQPGASEGPREGSSPNANEDDATGSPSPSQENLRELMLLASRLQTGGARSGKMKNK